ncbi:hypothetical protein [Streptomyces sp. NPDC056140]|uniref:hypothetical protein n=1 Tax=Streptomyces sp. NPDC056140 TaxID=3345725 RepID=UPI0035D5626E
MNGTAGNDSPHPYPWRERGAMDDLSRSFREAAERLLGIPRRPAPLDFRSIGNPIDVARPFEEDPLGRDG